MKSRTVRFALLALIVGWICLGPSVPAVLAQWHDYYEYDYYYDSGYYGGYDSYWYEEYWYEPVSYVVPYGLGGCNIEIDD